MAKNIVPGNPEFAVDLEPGVPCIVMAKNAIGSGCSLSITHATVLSVQSNIVGQFARASRQTPPELGSTSSKIWSTLGSSWK